MAFHWYTGGPEVTQIGSAATPSPKTLFGSLLWARWAKGFAVKPAPAPTMYEVLGTDMKGLWYAYSAGTWTKDSNSHASTSNFTQGVANAQPVADTTPAGNTSLQFNSSPAAQEDGVTGGNVGGLPGSYSGEYIWAVAMNVTSTGAIQQVHRIIDGSLPNTLSVDASNKFTDSGATIISDSAITGAWHTFIIVGNTTNTRLWVDGVLQSATGAGSAFGGTSATWGAGTHEFGVHNAGTGFEAYPLSADVSSLMIGWRSGTFSDADVAAVHAALDDIVNGYEYAAAWTDEEQALKLVQTGSTLLPNTSSMSASYPAVFFDADASAVDYLITSGSNSFPTASTSLMTWGCFTIESGTVDTVKLKTFLSSSYAALMTIELVSASVVVTDETTAATMSSATISSGSHYYVVRLNSNDSAKLYVDGNAEDTSVSFDTSVILSGTRNIKVGS